MTIEPLDVDLPECRATSAAVLPPWTWASRRREDATTRAIWDLLSPADDASIAKAVTRGLLAGVDSAYWSLMPDEPMYGYLPIARGGPDLLLLDCGDRVHAVIEHKRSGPSQVTAAVTMLAGEYFDDAIARSVVPAGNMNWHPPAHDWSCGCAFHTQPRKSDRFVRAGVWQIDGYRSIRWWLGNADRANGLRVPNRSDLDPSILCGRCPRSTVVRRGEQPSWIVPDEL